MKPGPVRMLTVLPMDLCRYRSMVLLAGAAVCAAGMSTKSHVGRIGGHAHRLMR